jgi:hypothetical protein
MKKSIAFFVMAICFALIALVWFIWVKNTTVGVIWLIAAVLELFVASAEHKKENKD